MGGRRGETAARAGREGIPTAVRRTGNTAAEYTPPDPASLANNDLSVVIRADKWTAVTMDRDRMCVRLP